MASQDLVKISKFLSLVLRHQPETIGLTLDSGGWVDVDLLLNQARQHGQVLDRGVLEQVVATNSKKRFALSADGRRIRANQGHSVSVDLGLEPVTPPAILYHGTAQQFLPSILQRGLLPGQRMHVHLSGDEATARSVGRRHGVPVILRVDALGLAQTGQPFYLSENGVWLTSMVAPEWLAVMTSAPA